jgi:deoxyribodipyrimidine photolyase-related protein
MSGLYIILDFPFHEFKDDFATEVIDKAIQNGIKDQMKIQSTRRVRTTNNRLARIHARIYWLKMPEYASMNFFNNQEKLPDWFWTGKTKMNCLKML